MNDHDRIGTLGYALRNRPDPRGWDWQAPADVVADMVFVFTGLFASRIVTPCEVDGCDLYTNTNGTERDCDKCLDEAYDAANEASGFDSGHPAGNLGKWNN